MQLTSVRTSQKAKNSSQETIAGKLVFFGLASAGIWLLISNTGSLGRQLAAILFGILVFASFILILRRKLIIGLAIIAYLAAMQPAFREYAVQLPYLALEYVTPVWAMLVFLVEQNKPRFRLPLVLYSIYIVLEILGLFFMRSFNQTRGILLPSIALLIFLLISSKVSLNDLDLANILGSFLIGSVSIAILISQVYFSGRVIYWITTSNYVTSGGMGPLHVSLMLSIGVFICLLLWKKSSGLWRSFFPVLGIGMTVLMILTFSRTGLYILVIALGSYFLLQRPDLKPVLSFAFFAFTIYLAFRISLQLSGTVVVDRYANEVIPKDRIWIAQQGWNMFLNNMAFGIGTGNFESEAMSAAYLNRPLDSHNELIRAAAEHGIGGLIIWILFAVSSVRLALKDKQGEEKSLRLAFWAMVISFMFVNALKLMVQPFLMFLAFSAFERD